MTVHYQAAVREAPFSERRKVLTAQLRTLRAASNPPRGLYFLTADATVAVSEAAWERVKAIAIEDLEQRLAALEESQPAAA